MFLHFHGKYNMILFVPKILDHMQIKTLNFFYLFFIFIIQQHTNTHTHTHIPFLLCFSQYTHV
jgi:hypothetical protein